MRRPVWLPNKNKREHPAAKPQGGGKVDNGNAPTPAPSAPKKPKFHEKGEVVINQNQPEELKVPAPGYRDVFAPEFSRSVKLVPHEDGTLKCNNWQHNDRCRAKCPRLASHSKALTEKDKIEFRKYMLNVFGNWSSKNGNGAVPPGQPPAANAEEGKTPDQ